MWDDELLIVFDSKKEYADWSNKSCSEINSFCISTDQILSQWLLCKNRENEVSSDDMICDNEWWLALNAVFEVGG